MALAHEVRSFFSGKVRLRGHECLQRRAVVIDRGDAWSVRALVRGTERYQVDLSRGPSRRIRQFDHHRVVHVSIRRGWRSL